MGYMRHHALIITSWDEDKIKEAHKRAETLFHVVSPVLNSTANGYLSFFIPPDGSKEGWADSNAGDMQRDGMIQWLNEQAHDDGSTCFDWVEVQYGDDEKITVTLRDDVNQRNAREAVPDLLDALKDVCSQYPLIHSGEMPGWIRNAQLALDKATKRNNT